MLPDLCVEMMPVASLAPYAANARTHPEAQVAQLAASIAEFGFNVPVLVDDAGVLVAGHGRVLAAKALGLDTVPAIRLSATPAMSSSVAVMPTTWNPSRGDPGGAAALPRRAFGRRDSTSPARCRAPAAAPRARAGA
ncbi:ParB/Srx family N-terminal domain-containing protein [Siccirubricoccus soli]|uniref:ParB/Srx family N-terminal domain-containing protein n=1 Tax=Siccirubricoccus soli TaxID=2899147 RepID=UPI003516F4AD